MIRTEQTYETSPQLVSTLKKYQLIATFVGLLGFLGLIVGYFTDGAPQFLRSYLVGLYFWFGAGMGALVMLMIQFVSGGAWGVMIRRLLEAGSRTIYVMWLAFLPLIIFAPQIYSWANPAYESTKIVQAKHLYLNLPFFYIRYVIYGVIWMGITYLLNKWSRLEDETKSMEYSSKLEKLSAPGIVVYFFTITFASVDYLMSLDVTWFSTIYGFLIAAGQALTAMSIMVATLVFLGKYTPLNHLITKRHLHDLGKLLLALVMFWAYLSFSQYLITYSGNLPEEVSWYIKRLNGGWEWIGLALLLLHFALPFALLLSQSLKKNPRTIFRIAILIICIRVVDIFWLVEPNFTNLAKPVFTLSWLDIVAPIAFGGLWLALFFRGLPTRPLLPLGAPDLLKALDHGREH